MTTQDEFVTALRAEYLDEATCLLERCEESLLGLEATGDKAGALAELFRALHTIKGSGAAVGFDDLVRLAHVMEDLLSLLRARPEAVTTELVSLLFRGSDLLKARVRQHKERKPGNWDVSELTVELASASQALNDATQVIPFDAKPKADELGYGFFEDPAPAALPSVLPECKESTPSAKQAPSGSIKVDAQRIDAVLDMVGELVIAKSQLINRLAEHKADPALQSAAALLDTIVRDLQDRALSIRMTPLKPAFLKLQRLARDLSLRCGKKVEFVMAGEDTELDRTMVEELADPLMHMMRNAIDHGIEGAAQRKAAGKPETGTIRLVARQVGSRVEIEMRDDGGGLSKERIVAMALDKGLIASGEISDRDAFSLIFRSGFSTAEKVSDVSGRGVGMDVVKTNVERLKGTVEVRSEAGQYTSFVLTFPLTAAISDGIQIKVGEQAFLVPIDSVRDLAEPESPLEDRTAGLGHDVVRLKGRILPLVDLRRLAAAGSRRSSPMLVVVEAEGKQAALVVDQVVGQMQVVLKPLCNELCRTPGMAGAAIMGDGKVALVLDVTSLLSSASAWQEAA